MFGSKLFRATVCAIATHSGPWGRPMNREKAPISLSNSVLPNTLVCYSCWRSLGKICSENMVLEKICFLFWASELWSKHNLCWVWGRNQYLKHSSKTELKANILLSSWQEEPRLCLYKLLFTAILIKYLLAKRLSCNISKPFIDETVSFKSTLLS